MSVQEADFRAPLCKALQKYAESHPEQKITADRMLDFVRSTPHCFERSHAAGHMTGSAWLLNPAGDKALLTLHHNLQRWMQTGGHADGDPDTLRVALKEAEEESGITGIVPITEEIFDIDIHLIPARPAKGESAHYHYDVRYLLRAPHEQYAISHESDDLAWWSAEDFATRAAELDASVLRMAELWMQQKAPAAH
jgi:8-oxo-dGTP pyrophosphatase MutT (NUDIX family)